MKNNKLKKIAAAVLSLVMVLSMSACGHQHTWTDATCTVPKTCTECGETEGEALGHNWQEATCAAPKTCGLCKETEGETLPHTWQDATCAAPKTCSVCGETEGEALPHTLTEANFQTPATCTVCGATEGDVLTPDFVTHNIPLAELGVAYDFIEPCSRDDSKSTVAHVTITDYEVFESDDTHPAKEGYEYRQVLFSFLYDDDNARNYGWTGFVCSFEDYYDIKLLDDSPNEKDEEGVTHTINYNGQNNKAKWITPEYVADPWLEGTCTGRVTFTVLVPVGYDGSVVGIHSTNYEHSDGVYIYDIYEADEFILFRLA